MVIGSSNLLRRAAASCLTTLGAGCCVLAGAASTPAISASHQPQFSSHGPTTTPLVIEAVVVDRKGAPVDDMQLADFTVVVDGQPRRPAAVARVYRGPGATSLAMARRATAPTGTSVRAEPVRHVIVAIDQGSLLQGDDRRARAVAENCIGLLGFNDRLMLLMLPDLTGVKELATDRDLIRGSLKQVHALRPIYAAAAGQPQAGASGAAVAPPDPAALTAQDPTREDLQATRPMGQAEALIDLDDLLRAAPDPASETISPAAAKAHAAAMLDSLRALLDGTRAVPGGKTLLLLSAGLIADEAERELRAVEAAAARSFTRIYALQVPTPSLRFAELGRSGLIALARSTGGSLIALTDKPAQALQQLVGELSASYLLMLDPVPTDTEPSLHPVSVTTRRKNLTIRTSAAVWPGRPLPDAVVPPPPEAVPSLTEPGIPAREARAKPPDRTDPELDSVLARASEYVAAYSRQLSAVVAEEEYRQASGRLVRHLVSDFLLVQIPGSEGWLPFRDVFEVDGVQVRDRDDRLKKLFLDAPPDRAAENAKTILEESARYNIGIVRRNVNVPTLALMFVHPEYISGFTFRKGGESTVDGVRVWEVNYREVGRPTIIRTDNHNDLPASGTLWIEPVSGRIVRTRLEASVASITVTYQPREELSGLWVPIRMQEIYGSGSTQVDATATYSRFRRFQVFTEEKIKPPEAP